MILISQSLHSKEKEKDKDEDETWEKEGKAGIKVAQRIGKRRLIIDL